LVLSLALKERIRPVSGMLLSHQRGTTLPPSIVRLVKLSTDDGYKKWIHKFSEVRSLLAKQPTGRPKNEIGKYRSIRMDIMEIDCMDV
jgi:hypothetical protein